MVDELKTPVCPECGGMGRRTWPRSSRIGVTFGFTDGYDPFAGAHFDSDRQRNNYCAEKGLRKLYKKPKGDIVKKI